jgi:hypothetical protein
MPALLVERHDLLQRLVTLGSAPILTQLRAVRQRPFDHQNMDPARQVSAQDVQGFDRDLCIELAVDRVEVRWRMVVEVNLDQDAEEAADRRKGCLSSASLTRGRTEFGSSIWR